MPASGRPCRLTVETAWSDQPSRAADRLKAEAVGRQSISSGGKRRISMSPTPKWKGSPLASTTTGRPRCVSISTSASAIGLGQGNCRPVDRPSASAR